MSADDGVIEGNPWPMPKFRFQEGYNMMTNHEKYIHKVCQRIITLKSNQKKLQLLNHATTIADGGILPKLSKRVWNSPFHYVQVAKYNKLNKFRNIKGGSQLNFPPLIQPTNS